MRNLSMTIGKKAHCWKKLRPTKEPMKFLRHEVLRAALFWLVMRLRLISLTTKYENPQVKYLTWVTYRLKIRSQRNQNVVLKMINHLLRHTLANPINPDQIFHCSRRERHRLHIFRFLAHKIRSLKNVFQQKIRKRGTSHIWLRYRVRKIWKVRRNCS